MAVFLPTVNIWVSSDHRLFFNRFCYHALGAHSKSGYLVTRIKYLIYCKTGEEKKWNQEIQAHLRWYWFVWVLFYSVHIMQENSLLSGERYCTAGKIHTCWSRQVSPLLGVSFLIACFSFFFAFFGQDFSLVSFDNRNTADMNLISVL